MLKFSLDAQVRTHTERAAARTRYSLGTPEDAAVLLTVAELA